MEDLKFYNPEGSNLRKGQLRMLEIAKEFDRICQKNNITYWIMSGTLLGARRHGGFIPWDDDFDVGVKREDFKKILTCLETELPEHLKLQTRKTDSNYVYHYAKIRDLKSNIWEENSSNRGYLYNGLFIDIFPFEYICLPKKWKLILDRFHCRNVFESKKGIIWRWLTNTFFLFTLCIIPLFRFLGNLTKYKYSHGYGIGFYATHKLSTCFPTSKIKFENYEFSAPNDVDQYLTNEYGNFMRIPPKEKRQIHSCSIEVFNK